MPGVFVTATGTDVGKTFIAAGLLRAARRAGLEVDALKPVLSGYSEADAAHSDAGVLLAAMGLAATAEAVARIAPWRFAAPLSPNMAAAAENRTIDVAAVTAACRAALAGPALTLVEGVGGVMVPLDDGHTVLDLMAALDIPSVLVTGTGLGAISHCLTAVAGMAGRGLAPALIVLNETAGSTVPTAATEATLAAFCPGIAFATMPREASEDDFAALLARLFAAAGSLRGASSRADESAA